jgi:hypothetical protein
MSTTFLRHTLATLAYRAAKPLRDAPPTFASFRIADGSRTPGEIVAHLGDLMAWGCATAQGRPAWSDAKPGQWTADVERFFAELKRFDECLALGEPKASPEKLFQGAIADSLTHVGQLAMLRRLAGTPIRGENYAKAEIVMGRIGLEQAAARMEFE